MNTAGAKGAEASGLLRFILAAGSGTTLLHGAIAVLGLDFSLSPLSSALYLYLAGLAVPSLAGIALTPKGDRIAFIRRSVSYRAGWLPLATAASAQLGILALAWLAYRSAGGTQSPEIQAGAGFAVLALGQIWVVLGEEFGWRGYALPRLMDRFGARAGTLAVAMLWSLWHAPMFFVANSFQAQSSIILFAASIFAWSAIHTALYRYARPSIVTNFAFHACANLSLNLGLSPAPIEPYLLAAYVTVGAIVLALLGRIRPARV